MSYYTDEGNRKPPLPCTLDRYRRAGAILSDVEALVLSVEQGAGRFHPGQTPVRWGAVACPIPAGHTR